MSLRGIADVVSALEDSAITEAWQPESDGAPLTVADVEALLRLVDHLQERGKSMLAMSLMRLVREPGRIVDGRIALAGRNLMDLSEREMRRVPGGTEHGLRRHRWRGPQEGGQRDKRRAPSDRPLPHPEPPSGLGAATAY